MNKSKAIANANAMFAAAVAKINERRNYRMENYYNCVDDYSFGGLCDKADNLAENIACKFRDINIEEINNGFHVEKSVRWIIKNANGDIVADTIKSGKFGKYFCDNDKFIGFPKKLTTLAKKGYELVCVEKTYNCVMSHVSTNMNVMNKSMTLVSCTETPWISPVLPEYVFPINDFTEWQFKTYFCN